MTDSGNAPMDRNAPIEDLIEHYRRNRGNLANLRAPRMRMTEGSDADQEYRIEAGLVYALDFIDVLLQRIAALEERTVAEE